MMRTMRLNDKGDGGLPPVNVDQCYFTASTGCIAKMS